jgi:hypothetical protein
MRLALPIALATAALASGCLVTPEDHRGPHYPGVVVVPAEQNVYENRTDTTNVKSKTRSTTTINNNTTIVAPGGTDQRPAANTQQVDDIQKFDKDGNPNYDADGNYQGGHGIGTMVDNPDAPAAAPEPDPPAEPEPAAEPEASSDATEEDEASE